MKTKLNIEKDTIDLKIKFHSGDIAFYFWWIRPFHFSGCHHALQNQRVLVSSFFRFL